MATELITLTYCDIHLQDKDEQVPGQAYPGFEGSGQSIDLCEECAQVRIAVQVMYDTYGAKGKRTQRPQRQSKAGDPGAISCPRPDCDGTAKNQDSLASHARHVHGVSLAQLMGKPTPFACEVEGCGRAFSTPAGLGRHVTMSHQGNPAGKGRRSAGPGGESDAK